MYPIMEYHNGIPLWYSIMVFQQAIHWMLSEMRDGLVVLSAGI